jgi:hypothetical protein
VRKFNGQLEEGSKNRVPGLQRLIACQRTPCPLGQINTVWWSYWPFLHLVETCCCFVWASKCCCVALVRNENYGKILNKVIQ